MAAGGLVRADQAGPLRGEEELHGEGVLSAGLKPVVKHWRHMAAEVRINNTFSTTQSFVHLVSLRQIRSVTALLLL